MRNRGISGLMAFARGRRVSRLYWRDALGFFDAQAYAVLASVRRAELIGDLEARDAAIAIGTQLMRHQRPLGQWAWHYNANTGGLVEVYPVYSVHQDGMAPMALLPLERAFGVPTRAAVARGVDWLYGNNELGVRLIEPDRDIVWRSIRRRGALRKVVYPFKAASMLGFEPRAFGEALSFGAALEVDRELRPYHLGWVLCAFAEEVARARRQREHGLSNGIGYLYGRQHATAPRSR